MVMITTHIN